MITYTSEKPKEVRQGKKATIELMKGIDIGADAVAMTVGPWGKNAIIEREQKPAKISNDGRRIIWSIILNDAVQDLGIQMLRQCATETDEEVGDGTSTTIILARAIIKKAFAEMGGNSEFEEHLVSPIDLYKRINDSKDKIVTELKKLSRPVKDIKELEKVAGISVENEKLGKIIARMVDELGVNGKILVEEGVTTEVETEIIPGGRWYGHITTPYQYTDLGKQVGIYKNYSILVTNNDILSVSDIGNIVLECRKNGKEGLLILAPKIDTDVVSSILNQNLEYVKQEKNGIMQSDGRKVKPKEFRFWGAKIISLTDDQKEDLAVFTGARFFDKSKRMSIKDITLNDLGIAERVVLSEKQMDITGGGGKSVDVNKRLKDLKTQLKNDKVVLLDASFKERLENRIAGLDAGTGIIQVGARTNAEMGYKKDKVDDAVKATKAALEDGVVAGGGKALVDASKVLKKNDFLVEILKSPYNQIQDNAGGKLEIGKDVLDPVKVTRIALESACSLASSFITTNLSISDIRKEPLEEIRKLLTHLIPSNTGRGKRDTGREDPVIR